MKFIYKPLLLGMMILSLVGCENFIGGDINADPNNPTTVPVSVQFPAFQIATADVYGGAFSRFNCMLSQQVEGVARQWASFNQYTGLTPNRFDAAWSNVYAAVLNETAIARKSAKASNFLHHEAAIDINEAFVLMMAADVWDNIPYSEAVKGIENTNPKYDEQSAIYQTVFSLLDNATTLLNGPSGAVSIGGEDVFYGGNVDNWKAAASALKARALLHQGKYGEALTAAQNSFTGASQNLSFSYPDANKAGQWYRFNRDREGDLEFHPTMRGIMTGLNDPRLPKYDVTFTTAHPYLVPNFLQELVTYREMQFIIAECAFRAGDTATAGAAYLKGIEASFARAGVEGYEEYVGQESVNGGGTLTLEHIMTQKYLGLFLDPEVYSDYRRTGIPSLTPVSGSNVPVRWEYPATEYLFNNSSPKEGDINIYNDKVGWNR